ncbi:ABC-type transport auxiliary lipoprotein family protein, partial [Mesorhizobium sp. M7A.F.Ca.CA.001.11.2.1]
QNIVIKPSDRSIQYLKGAQWADRLPLIVQARLAETFQRSGSFAGVGKPGEGLAIDYQVIVEIRSFEVRVDGGEHAEVDLFVRILNDRNGEVRASKSFTAAAPVSGSGNPAYVSALDKAFGDAAGQIVRWTDSVI